MTWNFRILIRNVAGCRMFGVHEVYYDERGEPVSWTSVPIDVTGDSYEDLTTTLELMLDSTNKQVLEVDGETLKAWREES